MYTPDGHEELKPHDLELKHDGCSGEPSHYECKICSGYVALAKQAQG